MNRSHPRGRAAVACALIVCLELLPVASALAQVPAIGDDPLFTVSTVKANLMMTLDNSGSMGWQFAPMDTSANKTRKCFTSHLYNRLYYNPNNTYLPPVKADGTRYPDSSYTTAWVDGFATTAGTRNLSTQFPATNNYGDTALGTAARGAYYHRYSGSTPATPVQGTCYADTQLHAGRHEPGDRRAEDQFRELVQLLPVPHERDEDLGGRGVQGRRRHLPGRLSHDQQPVGDRHHRRLPRAGHLHRHAEGELVHALPPAASQMATRPCAPRTSASASTTVPATSPAGGAVPDPIQYSCQQNYHLLTTDGQWNSTGASGTVGSTNYDNTLPDECRRAHGADRRVRHGAQCRQPLAAPVAREAWRRVDEHAVGHRCLLLDDRSAADDDQQRVHVVDEHGELAAHDHLRAVVLGAGHDRLPVGPRRTSSPAPPTGPSRQRIPPRR